MTPNFITGYGFNDALSSVGLNLGAGRAKSITAHYSWSPLSAQEISDAYRGAWLPRKVVDVPAEDATREWRVWDDKKVAALEENLRLKEVIRSAFKSARLWGWAGVYMGTGSRSVQRPMQPDEVIQSLTVVSKNYLSVTEWDNDPLSPRFGKPKYFQIGDTRVDPSRIVLLIGNETPDPTECLGDSVLESSYNALKNADSVAANVAELVFEAKIDVVKVPDLMASVGDTAYTDALNKRIALMMQFKSVNNALLMDKEEDWSQKQIVFGSLNELLMTTYQITAGAASIPMTRLLGRSASGLNASGNNEIRDYYDTVRSIQTMHLEPALLSLDEQLCRMAGNEKADYEWAPLWQADANEHAMANQYNALSAQYLAKSGLFTRESLAGEVSDAMGMPRLVFDPEGAADPSPVTPPVAPAKK